MEDRSQNRFDGRPLHYGRPLPPWSDGPAPVGGEHAISYTTPIPLGLVPRFSLPMCIYANVALRTAESGADGSNYTQVEIRAGTPAAYTVIATLDTQSNPGALEIFTTVVGSYLPPGQLLFAYWTRTGVGSVDYAGDYGTVILDITGVRQP